MTLDTIRSTRREIQAQMVTLESLDRLWADREVDAALQAAPEEVMEGLRHWAMNTCYTSKSHYRLKSTGRIAPWSKALRAYFLDDQDAIYRAAERLKHTYDEACDEADLDERYWPRW